MKVLYSIISFIFVAFIGLVLSLYFWGEYTPPKSPPRPFGVPANAVWAGGFDSGEWFQMEKLFDESKIFYFTIFNEYNGSIVVEGNYVLGAGCDARITKKILESISYYDGRNIVLKSQCKLVPNGWIHFGLGFKIQYKNGVEISRQVPVKSE